MKRFSRCLSHSAHFVAVPTKWWIDNVFCLGRTFSLAKGALYVVAQISGAIIGTLLTVRMYATFFDLCARSAAGGNHCSPVGLQAVGQHAASGLVCVHDMLGENVRDVMEAPPPGKLFCARWA